MNVKKSMARSASALLQAVSRVAGRLGLIAEYPSSRVPPNGTGEGGGTSGSGSTNGGDTPTASAFVGNIRSGNCHADQYNSFIHTRRPFKLNDVVDSRPPVYPITESTGTHAGLTWDDVAFAASDYRYIYRVADTGGFVVLGPSAQYNYPTGQFSAYGDDDSHTAPSGTPGHWISNIGRKPDNCGRCHTTAYGADVQNRRGLDGFVSDWEHEEIRCEECHGIGAGHAAAPPSVIVAKSGADTVCGKCHTRSPDGIASSGGFVRHHEQRDEFNRSPHVEVILDSCATRRDPHQPLFVEAQRAGIQALAAADGDDKTLDLPPPPPGIIRECTNCHTGITVTHPSPNTRRTCYMAFTTKSVVDTAPNSGDIRSHAWLINTDAAALAYTDVDGNSVSRDDPNVKFAAPSAQGHPFITLDFASLRCHSGKGVTWAADDAAKIHSG